MDPNMDYYYDCSDADQMSGLVDPILIRKDGTYSQKPRIPGRLPTAGIVYEENPLLTNPQFHSRSAEAGIGENTCDDLSHVLNYGLADHHRHQQQSVIPDQTKPNSQAFTAYGTSTHAPHHESKNSLKHQDMSAPMELVTVNVKNTPMNHQAIAEKLAGSSQPSKKSNTVVDPRKKLAKQMSDLKYREKKKMMLHQSSEEVRELKRKVDVLTERNKHLENENVSMKKEGARMEIELKKSKRDFQQLKDKHEGLSTTVTEISKALAESKYIEIQCENERLKSSMNLLLKKMHNPESLNIIKLQARIAQLEHEVRARQLVIDTLCAKMIRDTDDEPALEG